MNLKCNLYTILFMCSILSAGFAQDCNQILDTEIFASNEKEIIVQVSGLTNNDLSNQSQGLCKVDVTFNHSSLEVFRFELESPNGEIVQLIGPATVNGANSQFIDWEVSFVPCSFPASPDGSFDEVWTNNNAWAALTDYNGSYHPHNGCLENFDQGNANGNWVIHLEDLGTNTGGIIKKVELTFCDDAGIACNTCDISISQFDNTGDFSCEGDITRLYEFESLVEYESPETQIEKLVLIENGNILNIEENIETSNLPVGVYQICALVASSSDFDVLNQLSTKNEILADIDQFNRCAKLTTNCKNIVIDVVPNSQQVIEAKCQDETFEIEGLSYALPLDTLVFTYNENGCESGTHYVVDVVEVTAEINPVFETIDETNTLIALSASNNTSNGPGVTYEWTTSNGSFAGAVSGPTTIVDAEGVYYLTVYKDGCSTTVEIEIFSSVTVSEIELSLSNSLCVVDTVQILVDTDISIKSFAWSGPSFVDNTELNPLVTEPGTYTISIIPVGSNEAISESIEVSNEPVGSFSIVTDNPVLTCPFPSTELTSDITNPNQYTYQWIDQGMNVLSTDPMLQVNYGGTFTLVITNQAGCSNSDVFQVTTDFIPHVVNIAVDSINCNQEGQLFLTGDGPIKNISWSGPNFSSNDQNPIISDVGSYKATVVFEDECRVSQSVTVDYVFVAPDIILTNPTLNCDILEAPLSILTDPSFSYKWEGPGVWTSGKAEPLTDKVGNYRVTVTDDQGCEAIYPSKVRIDTLHAKFDILVNDIDCNNNTTILDYQYNTNSFQSFTWTGPSITNANENEVKPEVSSQGVYTIAGKTNNGCPFEETINVVEDFVPVQIMNDGSVFEITCAENITGIKAETDKEVEIYEWTFNGNTLGIKDSITVGEPGTYLVDITGVNGCKSQASFTVNGDVGIPVVEDLSITEINCIDTEAQINFNITDANGGSDFTYNWFDIDMNPVGFSGLNFNSTDLGMFLLESTNDSNGCSRIDTIEITENIIYPEVSLANDTINCTNTLAQIAVTSDLTGLNFEWNTPEGIITGQSDIMTEAGQPIYLTTTGDNGCVKLDTIQIQIDTLYPTLNIQADNVVGCSVIDLPIAAISSVGNEETMFDWWTLDGTLSGDTNNDNVLVNGEGYYFVWAENIGNHCVTLDSVLIEAGDNLLANPNFELNNPLCNNEANGIIEFTSIDGANGDLSFALNNGNDFQDEPTFTGLLSGEYSVQIQDETGCSFESIVTLEAGNTISVEVIDEITVTEGDFVNVDATYSQSGNEVSFEWSSNYISECGDCQEVVLNPFADEVATVTVEDENGCTAEASVNIYVEDLADVWVPNIFSPSAQDSRDQQISLYLADFVDNVNEFAIFNRWGNKVYSVENVDPNTETITWNGEFNGQLLNSGVYVVVIDYTVSSGESHTIVQDLTLIQ